LLERLEKQLYKDAMALDTTDIASGAVTATQIEAAYEPLNEKLDLFEAQVTDFIHRLLTVAGVEDDPIYERSILVNKTEMIQSIANSALYLDDDYVTEKIMTVFGDKDKVQEVLDRRAESDINRMSRGNADTQTE
jgi:enoyl reductase-like protein